MAAEPEHTGTRGGRDAAPGPPEGARPVALVTGAGSGIGRATALQLAAEGWDVAVVGRRAEALDDTAALARRAGATAHVVPGDLRGADAPAAVVRRAAEHAGRLDGLVLNAGVVFHQPLDEWTVEQFDEHVAVNVRAPFFAVQAALPWLRRSPHPAAVTVSSSSATLLRPTQCVYGMSKAALEYVTRSLAAELAVDGIRLNCVAPGPIDTPIHETWADDLDEARRWLGGQVPLGRIGAAAEVASWICRLLAPSASFVTGAVLPVDGGQTLDLR